MKAMNKKQRRMLLRIVCTAALLAVLAFLPARGLVRFGLYFGVYLLVGYDILRKALKGVLRGRVLDESFLMAVATLGAMALGLAGSGDYVEGIAVMLLYQVGELFQSYAVGRSRQSISALMDIRPDHANLERDGALEQVDPEEVPPGSVIVVQPGERVPLDGVVVSGESTLNTAPLTGESLPRAVQAGDEVLSGCINMMGLLRLRTTREFGASTVSKILELVENASSRKSKSEAFISRFARSYTPAVCSCALALAVLPPVALTLFSDGPAQWGQWLYRALSFLVASCPCALVVSIPLSFFGGLGGASRQGILIKGSNYLELLSKTGCVVFDKTGTLTQGVFEVQEICSGTLPAERLLEYAALAESASSHPIARSLLRCYGKPVDRSRVTDVQELSGHGVLARVDGTAVAAGSSRLMAQLGIMACSESGTVVHVAVDGSYAGCITVADVLKPTAAQAVASLQRAGIKRTVMLTGDAPSAAAQAAEQVGIREVYSGLLPQQKVEQVERLLEQTDGKLVFVGDGINDAPVLARADIGIAMGALGSDAAVEAADVVLMDDDPLKLVSALGICRKCMAIVRQNTVFAIGVKVLALVLVALGRGSMALAVFADVGVTVLAVLNAIRTLYAKG